MKLNAVVSLQQCLLLRKVGGGGEATDAITLAFGKSDGTQVGILEYFLWRSF